MTTDLAPGRSDAMALLAEPPAEDTAAIIESLTAAMVGVMPPVTPENLIALRDQQPVPAVLPDLESIAVDTDFGPVKLRVYPVETPVAVYVHIHGGGWTGGAYDHQDTELTELSERLGATVLSVDYRLAPEQPFPAAQDDCEAAVRWVIANCQERFGVSRLFLGGESAGSHLSLATAIRLRNADLVAPIAALDLRYGMYDFRLTHSVRQFTGPVLNYEQLHALVRIVTTEDHFEDHDVSPILAPLQGLPPAVFTVGSADSLVDDTVGMYARFRTAGIPAELVVIPGGWHGADRSHPRLGPPARQAAADFLLAQL
jgi:acetyl esterase/lipase